MPYSAPYLKKQADDLINILDLTAEKRTEIYRHYEISGRFLGALAKPAEKQKIIEEFKSLNEAKNP